MQLFLRRYFQIAKEMPFTIVLLVAAVVADDLTTALALARGIGAEANPISDAILAFGPGWLYGLKLALIPIVIALLSLFDQRERLVLRWVIRAAAIALCAISAHNLLEIY